MRLTILTLFSGEISRLKLTLGKRSAQRDDVRLKIRLVWTSHVSCPEADSGKIEVSAELATMACKVAACELA